MIPGYRIIRELGRGGMATVYLAEQESLGREVALKVLSPTMAADADFAERFLREARISGGFRHRHLISVLDAGRAGDRLFLAMEYVPTGTAARLRGGDPTAIRQCLIEVARALSYAHERGIVHRDIKPDNILMREDGSFLLSDFGIARSPDATRQLTGPQAAIGTPGYMSPEQWRGEAIDGRADLYSLGVVAFELLTGQLPFGAEDPFALGLKHMTAARPQLPSALADWQPIIDRLLAVERGDRYAHADALLTALGATSTTPNPVERIAPGATVALPRAGSQPHSRWPFAVAVVVMTMALAGAAVYYAQRSSTPETAATGATMAAVEAPAPAAPAVQRSVAVLPFEVLSADPSDALFADGLTEEIRSRLSNISGLKVPGRTSSFAFRGKSLAAGDVAAALGVQHLLEGSVRRAGTRLRITASLVNIASDSTLFSQTFDKEVADVLDIQNDIALAVADEFALSVGAPPLPTLARLPPEERARYLEASGALYALDGSKAAQSLATLRALAQDYEVGPELYVRLIDTTAQAGRNTQLSYSEALREQSGYAKALGARFPGSVEERLGQMLILASEGDAENSVAKYTAALTGLREIIELAPNNALAISQAAFTARALLRFDEAVALAERAVSVDPADPRAHLALAHALGSAGRGNEAVAVLRDATRRLPDSTLIYSLMYFLDGNGEIAEAVATASTTCAQPPRPLTCVVMRFRALRLLGFMHAAERLLDDSSAAERVHLTAWRALYQGQLPDPTFVSGDLYGLINALAEAYAQGRPEMATQYLRKGWLFLNASWFERDIPPAAIDMRAALSFAVIPLTDLAAKYPERASAGLLAIKTLVAQMPPESMPYPIVGFALGSEILSHDLDAAFKRLDGLADGTPLNWDYWVISPSGREMPTAKALRADPRFAAIWQRRADLIARERAKLLKLMPGLD